MSCETLLLISLAANQDEPTNDLDVDTLRALEAAIEVRRRIAGPLFLWGMGLLAARPFPHMSALPVCLFFFDRGTCPLLPRALSAPHSLPQLRKSIHVRALLGRR